MKSPPVERTAPPPGGWDPHSIVRIVRAVRRAAARAKLFGNLEAEGRLVVGPRLRATRGSTLRTARQVTIGADCTLMAHVDIGPDVMVSSHVAFIGDDHPFQGLQGPITGHPPRPLAHIVLEGDNLIGYGAILIGPLTVGRGAVIAAGAVVTGNIPPDTVYGGVPARLISARRPGPPASDE